jgi:hypothetical protein
MFNKYYKSDGQTGAIAPRLDASCTNRTANIIDVGRV